MVSHLAKTFIWRTSGVVSTSTSASMPLMRPISVFAPVATTTPLPCPAGHHRAAEGHAGAVAERGIGRNRRGRLFDRHGFAGQDRFLDLQARACGSAAGRREPCRPPPAGRCRREPVSPRRSMWRSPSRSTAACGASMLADGFHRLFGLAFLDEADHRIGDHDREDHHRVDEVLHGRGDRRRSRAAHRSGCCGNGTGTAAPRCASAARAAGSGHASPAGPRHRRRTALRLLTSRLSRQTSISDEWQSGIIWVTLVC